MENFGCLATAFLVFVLVVVVVGLWVGVLIILELGAICKDWFILLDHHIISCVCCLFCRLFQNK